MMAGALFSVTAKKPTMTGLPRMLHPATEAPTGDSCCRQEADGATMAASPVANVGGLEVCENSEARPRGWVFYDGECRFCVRGATRWGDWFARRGFLWLPLQTHGTTTRLRMDEAALRAEMKLLHADGRVVGGVDAWAVLFRSVWWLWPLGALLSLPGIRRCGGVGYRWVARNRYCWGGSCELDPSHPVDQSQNHTRHGAFFELP